MDLMRNMDFQGNEIYSTAPLDPRNPLGDMSKRAMDWGGYFASHVITPVPFETAAREDISPEMKWMSFLGMGGPAAKWMSRTPIENEIMDAYRKGGGKVLKEEAEARAAKRAAKQGKKSTRTVEQATFPRLPAIYQDRLLEEMSPEEVKTYLPVASKEAKALYHKGNR
jgi:hypothetical protein